MPQIVNKKSVLEMAMGAIAEITDYEVERVVANIMDPNTNATAKRKITITLTFAPDDYRQQIGMDAQAKTTLAPIQPVRTSLCITKARDGSLLLAEMTPQVPGQVDMDGDESPRTGYGPRRPCRILTQKGQGNGKQLFERRY